MAQRRLKASEIHEIEVLHRHGISKTEIARRFGVTEGTVRYHLKKDKKKEDGRKNRYSEVSVYSTAIEKFS